MPSLEEYYLKSDFIVSREISGEFILVPISRHVGDMESIYMLNETAACVWGLMDGRHSLQEVLNQILIEFEVSEEVAFQDLIDLITQLLEVGVIVKV